MRAMLGVSGAIVLLSLLGACASHVPPDGQGGRGVVHVTIALSLDASSTCKATTDPKDVTATREKPVVRWTVTDNCSPAADQEGETVLVFKYPPNTKRKWLDPRRPNARTPKGKQAIIEYVAKARGQVKGAEAEYSIFYDGSLVADPKVVWGN